MAMLEMRGCEVFEAVGIARNLCGHDAVTDFH